MESDRKRRNPEDLDHHNRFQYCHTRPKYRAGRNLTAVKVYSVCCESRYLLVFGVPKINLQKELLAKFKRFGDVESCNIHSEKLVQQQYALEQFTDCFLVKFVAVENARKAKKFLDASNFYGGILHISYAPELESKDDTVAKITKRSQDVAKRVIIIKYRFSASRGDERQVFREFVIAGHCEF